MLLSIDPGLNGTGWAFWDYNTLRNEFDSPDYVGVISGGRGVDFVTRSRAIASSISSAIGTYAKNPYLYKKHLVVVCEFPNFQDSGSRSMGWRSGDLQKLTFLVGVFAQRFSPHLFEPVEPYKWKGQLPKSIVEARIRKRLGKETCDRLGIKTHAWDAVGIGLWYLDGGRP